MPIVYDKLLALKIPDVEHSYGPKDCMLYALGVGLGHDPVDEDQLAFVYEKNLKVLPTMAVVIGYPGFWAKDSTPASTGSRSWPANRPSTLHRPLTPRGTVISQTRVTEIIDKGAGKGARALFRAHHRRQGDRRAHRHASRRPRSAAPTAASAGRRASSRRRIRSRSARPISSATCRRGRRWR